MSLKHRNIPFAAAIVLAMCLLLPPEARPALVYKNYIVQQDGGMDILCAPYTVQPGDWVIKILKLRGEIAAQDFPYFLQIFARINPQVKDVNRIRPGEQIFIPLREMPPGSFQDRQSGLVTIPFVDLSSRTAASRTSAAAYRVRRGDSISKLVASRYGRYGSDTYQEGIKHLTALNPQIKELDLIFVDQVIFLPSPISAPSKNEVLATTPETTRPLRQPPTEPPNSEGGDTWGGTSRNNAGPPVISPLAEASAMMEASLLDSGTYVFPAGPNGSVHLNLRQTPVIDLPNGQKVMLAGKKPIEDADIAAVKTQWKNFRQLSLPANASLEQILEAVLEPSETGASQQKTVQVDAGGAIFTVRPKWLIDGTDSEMNPIRHICITPIASADQRTPTGIVRFLAEHGVRIREVIQTGDRPEVRNARPPQQSQTAKTFYVAVDEHRRLVTGLLDAMGYGFTRNVVISFPYAGIEVKAMSNLVTTRSGNPLFIDFGDLFGDAVDAIINTGFNIIQITGQDDTATVVDKLLTALDEPLSSHPSFLAAKRPERYNTRISIPGNLMGDEAGERTLVTTAPIAPPVIKLLNDQNIRIVILETPGGTTPKETQRDPQPES